MKGDRYRVIDEPQAKPWGEKLVVDPILILLAAMLVPLLWNPPALGRFWMPCAWLVLNSYALGSSTLGREIGYMALGALGWFAVLPVARLIVSSGLVSLPSGDVFDYVVLVQFGIYFFVLYLVVFQQSQSYQLFKYLRGDQT